MSWYQLLVTSYGHFVGLFPHSIQWLVSLLIIVGIVAALFSLIRHYILFVVAAIILIPLAIPVAVSFFHDAATFVAHLALVLRLTKSS